MARGPRPGFTRRSCTVSEHEFIYDVVGNGTNFGIVNGGLPFPINPGQVTTFPWLSVQAKQWEKYKIHSLKLEYRREVSEFATAGTIGKVMINVDLDAADAGPSSKTQVLDTDKRLLMDCMPCENNSIVIPGKIFHPTGEPKWVRPGGLPGATDIKTYDAGNIWVTTSGTSDNTTKLGELHLTYVVELSVPILESTTVAPINNSVATFESQSGTISALTTGTVTTIPLATAAFNGLGAVNTAGLIVLPAGNYLVDWWGEVGYSGASTNTVVSLYKNGAQFLLDDNAFTQTNAAALNVQVNGNAFVTVNGTDTISMCITATFSSGTASPGGFMRIVAI
jgi:hypothetical protein